MLIRNTIHTGGAEMSGGRIVSFLVDGAPGPLPQDRARASGPLPQAGGQDPLIDGSRRTQIRKSSRMSWRYNIYLV